MKNPVLWKIKIIGLLLVLGLGSASSASVILKEEAMSKFVKAGYAYKDGRYDDAINLYEEVRSGGLTSGALYYNLANSYFQKGALGKAILNYERARRLMPRDHDLRANHRYALSLVKNRTAEEMPVWRKVIYEFFSFFTVDELTLMIFILGVFTGSLYLIALFRGWSRRRFVMLLFLLLLIFFAGLISKASFDRDAAVIVAETPAQFEPRPEAAVHFDLPEGSQVKVLKTDGIWVKIERPDGKEGWVPREKVEKI